MKIYFLVSIVVLILILLIVSCIPEVEERSVEEEIFAAESKWITGSYTKDNSSQVVFTSCTDNDGDKPSYKGVVTARYTYNSKLGVFTYHDECKTEKKLVEFVCDGAKPQKK